MIGFELLGGSRSGQGKYILVNRLSNAVQERPSSETIVYHALVEVILGIIQHNDGFILESDLFEVWLKKLGLSEATKLPHCSLKVGELVTKRMLGDAFLRRTKQNAEIHFTKGPRSVLSRSSNAAEQFRVNLLESGH